MESMGRTILNVFKSYYAQLIKIDVVMATKGDLIVADDAPLKSMFSSKVSEKYSLQCIIISSIRMITGLLVCHIG